MGRVQPVRCSCSIACSLRARTEGWSRTTTLPAALRVVPWRGSRRATRLEGTEAGRDLSRAAAFCQGSYLAPQRRGVVRLCRARRAGGARQSGHHVPIGHARLQRCSDASGHQQRPCVHQVDLAPARSGRAGKSAVTPTEKIPPTAKSATQVDFRQATLQPMAVTAVPRVAMHWRPRQTLAQSPMSVRYPRRPAEFVEQRWWSYNQIAS